jgi:hypothetical protein
MAAAPSHRPPRATVRQKTARSSRPPRRRAGWYERELADRWTRVRGYSPKRRQLEGMVAFARWIDGAAPHAPPEGIVRTVGQFVRGPGRELGWRSTGSQRGDHDAYANRVRRTLDYLAVVGWVDSRSWVATEHREGLGILVVPGPCSSTGAAAANGPARRRACERRSWPDARRPVAGPGRFVVPLARSFRDLNCPPLPEHRLRPLRGLRRCPGRGSAGAHARPAPSRAGERHLIDANGAP